ncbi:hypothetical protein EV127DRAFT_513172 [Xylaria flabelliformis]|nr:hypothetical protein EV127DRAFT_513172 [Xylaria flabelliformis]
MDAPASPQGSIQIVQSKQELVSLQGFHAIVWTGFALCLISVSVRTYTRFICFHRLLIDDYLMLLALVLLAGTAATGQLVLGDVYTLIRVGRGEEAPGPNFLEETKRGILGFAVQSIFCYAGLWLIKLSFLVFFYRLGHNVTKYLIFWWIVLFFVIASLATEIGIVQYQCIFGPIDYILGVCKETAVIMKTDELFKVSVIIDVISDVLILCFPIVILWKVRINLRRKLILVGIFSLVAFTIAITVVRGSIFGGVYKSFNPDHPETMNITWIWFWFNLEFIVSFIIACLVSFRSLFAQESPQKPPPVAQPRTEDGAYDGRRLMLRERARRIHQSVLDTLRTWEGTERDMSLLPAPASGRLSVDFSKDEGWRSTNKSKENPSMSTRSLGNSVELSGTNIV